MVVRKLLPVIGRNDRSPAEQNQNEGFVESVEFQSELVDVCGILSFAVDLRVVVVTRLQIK